MPLIANCRLEDKMASAMLPKWRRTTTTRRRKKTKEVLPLMESSESNVENPMHSRKRPLDEAPEGRCLRSRRRRVRFSPRQVIMGRADAGIDRTATQPELYDCDVCGSRLRAGLRGFDVYGHCESCDFDICVSCCDNPIAAKAKTEAPRSKHHKCHRPLVLIDKNQLVGAGDDDDEEPVPTTLDEANKAAIALHQSLVDDDDVPR